MRNMPTSILNIVFAVLGNIMDKVQVVSFMYISISECTQNFEGVWFLVLSECRTWATMAWQR
jgi:hypothetical protein